ATTSRRDGVRRTSRRYSRASSSRTMADVPHGSEVARRRPRLLVPPASRIVQIEQDVLAKNNRLAAHNRGRLDGRGIRAWNRMSSAGAGKTTLLERTIRDLGAELAMSVIEGDQATLRDAERIRATGCPVVQINTGSGCHLDAAMLAEGLRQLDPPMHSI